MVVMEMPDGTRCEYRLRCSKSGLRLARTQVSYDLLTMVRDAGWRIHAVQSDIDRRRLRQAFGPDFKVRLERPTAAAAGASEAARVSSRRKATA